MRRKGTDQKKRLPSEPPVMTAAGVTRREWVLIGAVLVVGIGLRIVALSGSAVEHFDEGVYASNIYFGPPAYAYPQQRFYAPPLLPALIESGMIVGLPPNFAALLPSVLAGCLTIVALWWFGRSWFGSPVGLAAATLAALSDFHIAYSAAALTDVLLGLWLILAVDAMARSLLNGDFRWAVGAGLFTGLAWWTKYNGWLPLAIEAAALPVLWLLLRPPQKQLQTWIGCFGVTVIVACVAWSPYYLSLQSQGGYGPIAENHAKYVVGLAGWLNSAARQISNQYVIERLLSKVAVAAALVLPAFLVRRSFLESLRILGYGLGAGVLTLFLTSFFVVGVGAIVGCVRMILAVRRMERLDETWKCHLVGLALVVTWWGGLLVATPCYAPYPRIALPWLLAAWLGTAMNTADALNAGVVSAAAGIRSDWQKFAAIVVILLGICLFSVLFLSHPDQLELPRDRCELMHIAKQVRETEVGQQPRAIYVFGEPALFFQLRAAGEEIVAPVQAIPNQAATIDGQPVPTFLIMGRHAERDPLFQQKWATVEERWELVQKYDYRPSAMVWLDTHDPWSSPKDVADVVKLYRLRP